MPKLIIDDRDIEVRPGTKVIEAAECLGIMIPRFCYHPALGSVGACRVCAVKFLQGPVKGLQMSCMIDAQDGMVVSTHDPEAVDFRRHVIEWLMLHHPHDCPVCDEGGHCLLQDMTVSGGHGIRRYKGLKRTHRDQYLGPLLQHEMNRCIQCYRCSRYYQEFSGYHDLGVMGIAKRVYFGRHQEGVLQSPFAGNLADICPTGVFTDKPSRYQGRRWDFERSPSICIHCALGCATTVSARYRQVVRLEARFHARVNGYFICDRGRHGFVYAGAEQRPRTARLGDRTVDPPAALDSTAKRLATLVERHGVDSVACIGSLRSSLETQGALVRLCRSHGWPVPAFFDDAERLAAAQRAVGCREEDMNVSLRQVEAADAVLLVGCDPLAEAPMLALALRQAQRRGAVVVCIDPRPLELPLAFRHLPIGARKIGPWLARLEERLTAPTDPALPSGLKPEDERSSAEIAAILQQGRHLLIVCGTDIVAADVVVQAQVLARGLRRAGLTAALFQVLSGASAYSAALLSQAGRSVAQVIAAIEQKKIRALVVVESDPLWQCCDRQRTQNALAQLELLVVMDYLDGVLARSAHVFLPTATIFETGGVFVNQEGRAQQALPAFEGGIPIRRAGGGDHPPRRYGVGLPGGAPVPAWQMLATLTGGSAENEGPPEILAWLSANCAGFASLAQTKTLPAEGLVLAADDRCAVPESPAVNGAHRQPEDADADTLDLLVTESAFGSEELAVRSPQLADLGCPPRALLAAADAARLNLADGDRVAIDAGQGRIETRLTVADAMAPGTLILPRHRGLDWQRLGGRHGRLPTGRVRKIGN